MIEALSYTWMQNAVAAAVLSAVSCGIIGTLVVVNRMSSLTGAVAHASFGGLGLAYLLGVPPMTGAVVVSIGTALGVGAMSSGGRRESPDISMAALWATGMAAGLVFIRLRGGYAPDLMSWLFGSLLTVSGSDLVLAGSLDLLVLVMVVGLFKELTGVSYDCEFSRIRGVRTVLVRGVLLTLTALVTVMLMKMSGLIMVMALMTIPAAVSRMFTRDLRRMMVVSCLLALLLSIGGLALSYALDLPPGAVIILLAGALYFTSHIVVRSRTR